MFYIEYINLNLIEFQYRDQMMRKQGLNGVLIFQLMKQAFSLHVLWCVEFKKESKGDLIKEINALYFGSCYHTL